MGTEIFYCTECGARASGSDFAPGTSGFGAERSCCPACLGLPVVSRRESTRKIRKPAPAAVTAVAVRPRTVPAAQPGRSFPAIIGGAVLIVAGAVAALMALPPQTPPDPSAPPAPVVAAPSPIPVEPPKCGFAQRLARPEPAPELEAQAEATFAELEEAATALADEGRVPDALAQLGRFPETYRSTRAWANLVRLRARLEQRLK